jgi:excisionase family DNA binding protein
MKIWTRPGTIPPLRPRRSRLAARRAPHSLPSFYTIGEVAEALGVSTRTVRRWIAARALAVHRFDGSLVRIAERDLLASPE